MAIINDILDLSKIEAGKLDVEQLSVAVKGAAANVVDLFAERAAAKGIDLSVCIEDGVPAAVRADPVRLGQVLGNLVNNALKFTEKGAVGLFVEADRDKQGHVKFSIVDSGIGIPQDRLASIFSAFSQADQSTTRRFGGTGLGLTISQRLVQAMGGEIGAVSDVGHGSTFSFSLPAHETAAALHWKFDAGLLRSKLAILCVCGAATEQTLRHYLESAGFDVRLTGASTFIEACLGADLAFADLSSLEECDLRPGRVNCKIIALVALGQTDAPALHTDLLIDAVLERPVSRENFETLVTRFASGQPLQSEDVQTAEVHAFPNYSQARVLVADDSPLNLEVAQEALSRFGIKPDLANGGHVAFELCLENRYDLVLMDGSMPDLDGFETTRRLRDREKLHGNRPVPVVALTAHVVGAAASAWQDAGMNGVLHKPFTMQTMAECLGKYLTPEATDLRQSGQLALQAGVSAQRPSDLGAMDAANASDGILDPSAVAQLREMSEAGHVGFLGRVVRLYATHAPESFQSLRDAFEKRDCEAFARAAHALKSMSLNAGAQKVARLSARFEAMGRNEKALPSIGEVMNLHKEVSIACEALVALDTAA